MEPNWEPNWELLRESVLIIDKVKEIKFDLEKIIHPCGAIACAMGHIAMNPKMKERGLHLKFEEVSFKGLYGYPSVASAFFNISEAEAVRLFSTRPYVQSELTDKELWFKRMKDFFEEYGEPFPELSN